MALIDRKLQFPSKMLPLLYETSLTCQVNGVYIKSLDCNRKDERPQPTLLAKSSIFSSKIPPSSILQAWNLFNYKIFTNQDTGENSWSIFFQCDGSFLSPVICTHLLFGPPYFFINIIILLYVCAKNWLSITMRWTFDENYTHHRLETISLVPAGALNEI